MSCTCHTFSPWLKRIPLFIPSDVAFLHVNSFSIMATKHLISKRNFRYSTRVCSTKLAQLRGQNRGKIKACNNWLGLNRRFLHFKTNLLSFVHFLRNSKLFLGSCFTSGLSFDIFWRLLSVLLVKIGRNNTTFFKRILLNYRFEYIACTKC